MRGPGVLPVDGVPAVHDPRADQQHVIAGLAGEPAQRRGDHGAGMTAQHVPGVHVPGVAGIPGDRLGGVSEPVVVVGDRHDPRAAAPANLTVPGTAEPRHGLVDEDLDGVRPFGGIGQIPQAKVAPQLHGIEAGNRAGHGDSSFKRTGWGMYLPAWVHLSEAAGLTRRSASRRPTLGREARKSPCQHPVTNTRLTSARTAGRMKFPGWVAYPPPAAAFNQGDIPQAHRTTPIWTNEAMIDVDLIFMQDRRDCARLQAVRGSVLLPSANSPGTARFAYLYMTSGWSNALFCRVPVHWRVVVRGGGRGQWRA